MYQISNITKDFSKQDQTLLESIKNFLFGKTQAFEYIYNKTSPQLLAICKRYASNNDEAHDILQESYIKIYNNFNKFNLENDFLSWAKRIAINTSIDFYRKNKKLNFSSIEDYHLSDDIEEEEFVSNDILDYDIDKVFIAMQSLPDGYRMVLNLYAIEEKSHKEIAEILNINEGTSRSQLNKARKAIKNIFNHGK